MIFTGDQGWFFLSARDLIINHKIPLVGITASITWLYQGAIFTYFLAPFLWLFKFNPLGGAVLTILFNLLAIGAIYKVGKNFFGEKVGVLVALLFSTSPLIIIHSRTAYHTSLIPLFALLFFWFLYKLIKESGKNLIWVALLLAILFQLELSNAVLFFLVALVIWQFRVKITWRNLLWSFGAFILGLTPFIIYDLTNGFRQTLGFSAWVIYRVVAFFGVGGEHTANFVGLGNNLKLFFSYFQKITFWGNVWAAALILIFTVANFLWLILKTKKEKLPIWLIFYWILIPLLGFLIHQAPGEAYFPLIFPVTVFLVALLFERLINFSFLAGTLIFLGMISYNSYFLISKNYLMPQVGGPTLAERMVLSRFIIAKSGGKSYNLSIKGPGEIFENSTKNYEYLTWWLGNPPTKEKANLKFIIYEPKEEIKPGNYGRIYFFETLAVEVQNDKD